MIGDERELPAQEIVPQLVQGPLDGQGLFLHSRIVHLIGEELSADVGHWVFLSHPDLGEYRSQTHFRCVVWNIRGREKSGVIRTGSEQRACLRSPNALSAASDHVTRSGRAFRVRSFRGLARVAEPGINLVVPYQTKKRFHLFFGGGAGPVPVGCDLALLGSDVPPSDLVPLVGRLLQFHAALGGVGCESGPPQVPQDRPQLSEVDIPAGAVDDNELVHHPLERDGCAMNAEREDRILE
ncbi:uncharacterized protein LOC132452173 [Gadus macrocephalus]|uniref:uncharacterized protein LOC132452173 n=1 Tax=Gadus macrocephalus TaxID=80720 RepID=UPI0028CB4DFA|nr:uncharacterized protein LOC132452173 [Gadus macrocephalus]